MKKRKGRKFEKAAERLMAFVMSCVYWKQAREAIRRAMVRAERQGYKRGLEDASK